MSAPIPLHRVLRGPKGSIAVERFYVRSMLDAAFSIRSPELGDMVVPRGFTHPVQVTYGAIFDESTLVGNHSWVELVEQPVECRYTHCDPMHCRSVTADKSQFEPRPIPTGDCGVIASKGDSIGPCDGHTDLEGMCSDSADHLSPNQIVEYLGRMGMVVPFVGQASPRCTCPGNTLGGSRPQHRSGCPGDPDPETTEPKNYSGMNAPEAQS